MPDSRRLCHMMYLNIASEIEEAKGSKSTDSEEYYALSDLLEILKLKKEEMIRDCINDAGD